MSTPLTAEQYSELVRALEEMRYFSVASNGIPWQMALCYSPWCYAYLVKWFHIVGPITTHEALVFACNHMVAELCEERC